jgi:hypothetical protein
VNSKSQEEKAVIHEISFLTGNILAKRTCEYMEIC